MPIYDNHIKKYQIKKDPEALSRKFSYKIIIKIFTFILVILKIIYN